MSTVKTNLACDLKVRRLLGKATLLSPKLAGRLPGLLFVHLALLCFSEATVFDVNLQERVSKDPITALSADGGFNGINFVMAVHEQHPFVFFDCDPAPALEAWNKKPKAAGIEPVPSEPVNLPAKCVRQKECPDSPDNEPFCGITIEIAKKICQLMNCTVKFHITSENPNHWESGHEALRAIGAGQKPGEKHWADVAGGALHITADRIVNAHFTIPYHNTGYRMVVKRPVKTIDMWSFVLPFDWSLWLLIFLEITVVGMLFGLMEAPEITLAEDRDSDIIESQGWFLGFFDAWYWSCTVFTCVIDKAPRTLGAKLVMNAHGFFMLIILASYTANLASFLTNSDVAPSISGWETGDSPLIPKMMDKVNISIPGDSSQEKFLKFESENFKLDFTGINTLDTWEAAVDSVLCGNDDVTFHDEDMLLYYLNNEMVKFGDDKYSPQGCDVSTMKLEVDDKRCALMFTGDKFSSSGYGFAFGRDNPAFIAWTQAILRLQESNFIKNLSGQDADVDYKIGVAGLQRLADDCDSGDASGEFVAAEFYGLTLACGVVMLIGLLCTVFGHVTKRRHAAVKVAAEPLPSSTPHLDPSIQAAIKAGLDAALQEGFEAAYNKGVAAAMSAMGEWPNQTNPASVPRLLN